MFPVGALGFCRVRTWILPYLSPFMSPHSSGIPDALTEASVRIQHSTFLRFCQASILEMKSKYMTIL